jgi:hypothetical protein
MDAFPIVELRQYTLFGGRRDELIALFEQRFIESQAALGAPVIGTFRDRDDPDRFVWLRGFADMERRATALAAFYGGPVWKAHRNAANATMVDSDNVLLLRAALGFSHAARSAGTLLAFVHYLDDALVAPFAAYFAQHMAPRVAEAGADLLATFVTETSANTFPQLPVREKARVFVWFASPNGGDDERFLRAWHAQSGWRDGAAETLLPAFMRKPEILRLAPTVRSPFR